jgi:hypothetical protein
VLFTNYLWGDYMEKDELSGYVQYVFKTYECQKNLAGKDECKTLTWMENDYTNGVQIKCLRVCVWCVEKKLSQRTVHCGLL